MASQSERAWSALAGGADLSIRCVTSLNPQGLEGLYAELEMPLVRVLARMEHIGIGVDRSELERIREQPHRGSERGCVGR